MRKKYAYQCNVPHCLMTRYVYLFCMYMNNMQRRYYYNMPHCLVTRYVYLFCM